MWLHYLRKLKIQIFCRYSADIVHVSPSSAETLVRRGEITNYHNILSQQHLCQNYQNRLMCVEVIVCYISVVFGDTMYVACRMASSPVTYCELESHFCCVHFIDAFSRYVTKHHDSVFNSLVKQGLINTNRPCDCGVLCLTPVVPFLFVIIEFSLSLTVEML